MSDPLVSIIITTKNEEKYIENCLKSLKNQTYKKIEIILSDSCSIDKTIEIAKKYVNKIIIENTNIAAGRNLGAKIANGEIFVFIDADAILSPNWIEEIVKSFKISNKIVGVMGYPSPLEGSRKAEKMCKLAFLLKIFNSLKLPAVGVCAIGFAVRKEIFKKIGGFYEKLNVAEDTDFFYKVSNYGKIIINNNAKTYSSFRRYEKGGYRKWIKYWMKAYAQYILTGRTLKEYASYR
jgi:glycosyltransferase involved in cell wall biosynthesis